MPNQYSNSRSNRLQAIEEGKKTYIGSTACKHCGSYEKYVSSYNCAPCAIKKGLEKLSNEELMKPYRTKEKWAANRERRREKIRENNKKYSTANERRESLRRETPATERASGKENAKNKARARNTRHVNRKNAAHAPFVKQQRMKQNYVIKYQKNGQYKFVIIY